MKQPNWYILSGTVHSGKTSRLLRWIEGRSGICGILAPVIEGKRHLMRVDTQEARRVELLDTETGYQPEWRIGKYVFSKDVFLWGQQVLEQGCRDETEWMIIDEIGLLELDGKGLEPAVTNILKRQAPILPGKIILVVRESLRLKVVQHYNLESISDFEFCE